MTSILPILDNAPWCTQVPQCAALRAQTRNLDALLSNGTLDQIATLSTQLAQLDTPISTVTDQLTSTVRIAQHQVQVPIFQESIACRVCFSLQKQIRTCL